MLISEQKPMEEILSYLDGEQKVFIVGCKGCAEGCQSGGEQQANEMKPKLEAEGKTITGISVIDFACNEQLTRMTLQAHESRILASDSLLMLCCGIGVQAAAAVVDKVIHPGCNTVSLGGRHGEWRDGKRCQECGQCMLEYTGGICPMARCAKRFSTVDAAGRWMGSAKSHRLILRMATDHRSAHRNRQTGQAHRHRAAEKLERQSYRRPSDCADKKVVMEA